MILYYSVTQKTKVAAYALSEVLDKPVYELKSKLNTVSFSFIAKALYHTFTQKPYPVDNMPEINDDTIYLCAPIWGGRIAAPALYFIKNASLKNRTVNLLLTCENISNVDKYTKNAPKVLTDCIPGKVTVLATGKTPGEKTVLAEQLRELL